MTHYLTRAVLDNDAPEGALRPLLDPVDFNKAFDAHHRLIWTLFPGKNSTRDFIWRADDKGKFLIMSARPPQSSRLFKPLEFKPFKPVLRECDRLSFILRVNATKDRRVGPQKSIVSKAGSKCKDRRVDVVMHLLREQEVGTNTVSRPLRRSDAADEAAYLWLASQGERRGFTVSRKNLAVEDYKVIKLKRRNSKDATFGVLDIKGQLAVTDPVVFTETLAKGLGRAKAYGCGLMLVRRI